MTHNTDCEVLDDTEVQEAARELWDGDISVNDIEELFGWSFLGAGAARAVFLVTPDQQEGPRDSFTREAPCVVKFAKPGRGVGDGRMQNREEIHNFQSLPENLVSPESDPPLFVPLSDWDYQDHLWISAPEVDPGGGSTRDATSRLNMEGWSCDDLHMGNVGSIHGETIIVDYGLDCFPITPVVDRARDLSDQIEQFGCRSVVVHEDMDGADVEFLPPAGLPGGQPVRSASVISMRVDRRNAGVHWMEWYFGSWDADVDDKSQIEAVFETVIDGWDDDWARGIDIMPDVVEYKDGDVEVVAEMEIWDPVPPDIAIDMYADFVDLIEDEMPPGVEEVSAGQRRLDEIRQMVSTEIEQSVSKVSR